MINQAILYCIFTMRRELIEGIYPSVSDGDSSQIDVRIFLLDNVLREDGDQMPTESLACYEKWAPLILRESKHKHFQEGVEV